MVDTLTPAGCGGRHRRTLAIALFTLGAIAGAAAVGAVAGFVGWLLPGDRARLAVGVVIVGLALLRESGLVRLPVPAVQRQVPESWRRRLPLPVWTTGYGAILGTGLGTFQPVATIWATLAAIVAVGDPLIGAACMAAFGLARGVMVRVPVTTMMGISRPGRAPLRLANTVVLTLVMVALTPHVATAQAPIALVGQADPAVTAGATAATVHTPGATAVVVTPTGGAAITIPDAREPALSNGALAITTPRGVEVRLWRTGQVVLTVPNAHRPALAGRYLAYVQPTSAGSRLVVRDLTTRTVRVLARVGHKVDLGRPSISGRLVVWHEASGLRSRILLRRIGSSGTRVITQTQRRWQATAPSIARGRLVWIESDAERSWLVTRRVNATRSRVIATSVRGQMFTTTATDGVRAWATSWRFATTTARIVAARLP